MKRFYLKLLLIVTVSALAITGLTIGLIQLYHEIERDPLRHMGFRKYLAHRMMEIEYQKDKEALDFFSDEFDFFIKLTGPSFSYCTHPDYFSSESFTRLEQGPLPEPEEGKDKKSSRRKPLKDATTKELPSMTAFFENGNMVGLEISKEDIRCVIVRKPEDFIEQMVFGGLIVGVFLVFIGLAVIIKKWFVDPLNRLEHAIGSFAENMETAENQMPVGELVKVFQTFNDMKKQIALVMSDKERLLRDVSHDLKSPITRMRMAVELLDDSKVKTLLLNDMTDLSTLVTKILESRQGKIIRNQAIDAAIIVEQFLKSREFGVPVRMNILSNFQFLGNEIQLIRVFNNLIDNTEKYADITRGIDIEITRQDDHGFICFSDYGSGLTDNVLENLFEPFYKSDPSRRQDLKNGYGLGLSICKQIIETMGGQITAGRSQGNGLVIELVFPVD